MMEVLVMQIKFYAARMLPLLIILFLHVVASARFSYSDSVGRSLCYPRDSCRSYRKEDHMWGNYSCECGRHCNLFNTCCNDSPFLGMFSPLKANFECYNLKTSGFSALMITRCSERWQHKSSDVKYYCEGNEDIRDPLMTVPATSLVSGLTYKNYFCAMCNSDNSDSMLWSVSLETTSRQILNFSRDEIMNNLIFDAEKMSWGVPIDNDTLTIKITFKIPTALKEQAKKCYPNIIESCSSAYSNSEMHYKCYSYYSPIKVAARKYRNTHCALCNGVNITPGDKEICITDQDTTNRRRPFSFALLLDINQSDGDQVGLIDPRSQCGKEETYDPFFKQCRTLVCALPGHVVRNGKCVSV